MPKQPAICLSALEAELLKYKTEVISQDGRINPPSNPIWSTISKSFQNKISGKYLYVLFKQNRYNICEKLGLITHNEETFENDESSFSDSSTSENNSSEESNEMPIVSKEEGFCLTLTPEEWIEICPKPASYKSSERCKRNYATLTPKVWTTIISKKFYDATHLPCRIIFKRAKVHPNSDIFIRIFGKCSTCKSCFKAVLNHQPNEFKQASFKCTYKGKFLMCQNTGKRPMTGETKKSAISAICEKNMSASAYRNEQAHMFMQFGEPEPVHLPTSNALRILKHREKKKKSEHENPIVSINIIMHDASYNGAIKALGYDPFYSIYWHPSQLHVYMAYCKKNIISKLSIDATGSLVKKIKRPFDKISKPIFLYDAVINDQSTNMQYSVSSMLSESHNNHSIYNWLAIWIRCGAPTPKEVVCDNSVALLSGIIRAFTNLPTLMEYIERCFNIIFHDSKNIPKCFIRSDVAHTIKIISSWRCLYKKNFRIRNLYIRSLAQIIQSTNINDIVDLFECLITVALSETEGKNHLKENTRCERAKLKLKERISYGNSLNRNLDEMIKNDVHQELEGYVLDDVTNFASWMNNLIEKYKNLPTEEGDHDNLHYLPEICDNFVSLSKTLPLWSAVMVPFFKYGDLTASSAAVESNFNDLKNRVFSGIKLPIQVDEFIKIHLNSLDGKMKLVAAADYKLKLHRKDYTENIEKSSPGKDSIILDLDKSKTKILDEQEISVEDKTCVACKNGHLPTGSHKCAICGIFVHILDGCSFSLADDSSLEGYGEKRICLKCFKEKKNLAENSAQENWKGLLCPPKKRFKSTYLKVQPELAKIDFSSKYSRKPIGILKNGNMNTKAGRKDNLSIIVTNTCAYDSIFQIVAAAFCDSRAYESIMKSTLNNDNLLKIITDVASASITYKTYNLRAMLLKSVCPSSKLPNNVIEVQAESTIKQALEKMLSEHPSVTETFQCSNIKCGSKRILKRTVISVIVDNNDINNIEKCILKELQPFESVCSETKSDGSLCKSKKYSSVSVSDKHFFVELLSTDIPQEDNLIKDVKFSLNEIQKNIKIFEKEYFLRGSVSGIKQGKSINEISHYIAVCRRTDENWELYDDLHQKIKLCQQKKKMTSECLIYTI